MGLGFEAEESRMSGTVRAQEEGSPFPMKSPTTHRIGFERSENFCDFTQEG